MKFGLMFFAASEDSLAGDKYRLLVESARFGDARGFSSVWVPERHFTKFGGLYPNPAVLHAALAMCTDAIRLNAGSVVAPLHHPLRIAEEWSVVDNLSHGRVGLSFASGWNPDDFLFFPDRYASRHERLFDTMRDVQRAWRGEPIEGVNGAGKPATVTMYPRPVQAELPIWVTAAGNPQTFERAGASGANLLTHLLDQDEEVLASKIAVYRAARGAAGFDPATGEVTVMLHTFVGADADEVREAARVPYCEYIKANLGLLAGLAKSRGRDADLSRMSPTDRDEFVNFLYDRFAAERGLIGTPESCAPLVSRLGRAGVTEVACLLDFGPDANRILENLPHLARLKDLASASETAAVAAADPVRAFVPERVQERCAQRLSGDEFDGLLRRHGVEIDGAFRTVRQIWRRDGEALGELSIAAADGYHLHPAGLDACSRVLAAALPAALLDGGRETIYVPAGMRACDVHGPLTGDVWSHATLTASSNGSAPSFTGDVRVFDARGRALVEIIGLRLEPFGQTDGSPAATTAATPHAAGVTYERSWHPAPRRNRAAGDLRGAWIVVGDGTGLASEVTRRLTAEGGTCVEAGAAGPLRGIVYLRGLDAPDRADADAAAIAGDVRHAVGGLLDVVQRHPATPIWIATRGAMPVSGSAVAGVASAPLWGFGRVLAVERPGWLGGLIDLDPAAPPDRSVDDLLGVIATSNGAGAGGLVEDMTAFRGGEAFVPRLTRIAPAPAGAAPISFGRDETILITGGTGGLGLSLASWLADRGASHLILVGRREPSAGARPHVDRLIARGVDVALMKADVGDAAELQAQFERVSTGRPPLTALFHLAGVLDDGQVEQQTWDRIERVLRAKVDGAWNLHCLTRGAPLKHFVMFSSMASIVPIHGQAGYAAANAFLDALAHRRRAEGLAALAINWGPWAERGHAATEYGRQAHARLGTLGIEALSPDAGLAVLETLMQSGSAQAAAVAVDWSRLFRVDPAASRSGLLANLVAESAAPEGAVRERPSELVSALRSMPAAERRPCLLRHLSDVVASALKMRGDEPIDPRQRLFDLGLDSILAIEVKDRLERTLGRGLSATLLFVHPTLESLSAYILDTIVGAPPAAADLSALSEEELTVLLLREIDASHGA